MDERVEVAIGGVFWFRCPRCRRHYESGTAIPRRAIEMATDPPGVICRACAGDVTEAAAREVPALRGW